MTLGTERQALTHGHKFPKAPIRSGGRLASSPEDSRNRHEGVYLPASGEGRKRNRVSAEAKFILSMSPAGPNHHRNPPLEGCRKIPTSVPASLLPAIFPSVRQPNQGHRNAGNVRHSRLERILEVTEFAFPYTLQNRQGLGTHYDAGFPRAARRLRDKNGRKRMIPNLGHEPVPGARLSTI
jgi:hypothetical protein